MRRKETSRNLPDDLSEKNADSPVGQKNDKGSSIWGSQGKLTRGEDQSISSLETGPPQERMPGKGILKEPVWIWSIPVYFYLGSTAGTAASLAAAAECVDSIRFRNVIDRARALSSAFLLVGSLLLIHDLGRKKRFLNMLRVFRPSSPMSVGSWLLAVTTPLVVSSSVLSRSGNPHLTTAGRGAGFVSGFLGLPLAGYTGVLLGTTAVPFWQSLRYFLPPLFLTSGAASAVELVQMRHLNQFELQAMRRLEALFRSTEFLLMALLSHKAFKEKEAGLPLRTGFSGALWKAAVLFVGAGLCLHGWKRSSRRMRLLRAIAGVSGGLCLRFALLKAGKASSRNPKAVLEQEARISHTGS